MSLSRGATSDLAKLATVPEQQPLLPRTGSLSDGAGKRIDTYMEMAKELEGLLAEASKVHSTHMRLLEEDLQQQCGIDESMECPHVRPTSAPGLPNIRHSASMTMVAQPSCGSLVELTPQSLALAAEHTWAREDSGGMHVIDNSSVASLPDADDLESITGLRKRNVTNPIADKWFSIADLLLDQYAHKAVDVLLVKRCLHPIWTGAQIAPIIPNGSTSKFLYVGALEEVETSIYMAAESAPHGLRHLQRLVLSPSSRKRLVWDLLALMVLIYDIITLPLLVFNFDETELARTGYIVGLAYWSVDLVASLLTGYMNDVVPEMRITSIWLNYIKGWFCIDVVVLGADWWSLLIAGSSPYSSARVAKLGRFSRVLRLLRFARVIQMPQTFQAIRSLVPTTLVSLFNIVSLLTLPVMVSHFSACGWYGVATYLEEDKGSWLDNVREEDRRSKPAMYILCFHWAISQYTPAPNSIQPVTEIERVFTVSVLLIGFVIFTSFLGRVTGMVTTARLQSKRRLEEEWNLRRFITDYKVSFRLCHQIGFITRQTNQSRMVLAEQEISLFKTLPETLLIRLHFEVYAKILRKHPVMANIELLDRGTVVQLAHIGAKSRCCNRYEELFHFGYESRDFIAVTHGVLQYTPGYSIRHSHCYATSVLPGAFLCEPALWMSWHHQGFAMSPDWCNVVVLPATELLKYASQDAMVLAGCKAYSTSFIRRCAELVGPTRFYHIIRSKDPGCKIPNLDDTGLPMAELQNFASDAFMADPFDDLEDQQQRFGWLWSDKKVNFKNVGQMMIRGTRSW